MMNLVFFFAASLQQVLVMLTHTIQTIELRLGLSRRTVLANGLNAEIIAVNASGLVCSSTRLSLAGAKCVATEVADSNVSPTAVQEHNVVSAKPAVPI
jgi:hypothetical protein